VLAEIVHTDRHAALIHGASSVEGILDGGAGDKATGDALADGRVLSKGAKTAIAGEADEERSQHCTAAATARMGRGSGKPMFVSQSRRRLAIGIWRFAFAIGHWR